MTSHAGRRPNQFTRAAEGQMTLMEHIRELRTRLFKAVLAIFVCMAAALFVAERVLTFLTDPYCNFVTLNKPGTECEFSQTVMLESFTVTLQVALYLGLLVSAPFWLYQLWAFIAPGLHRRERRYTYAFAAAAAPLFILGSVLAFVVVERSLPFLLGLNNDFTTIVSIRGYFDFVTDMMLYFGIGFLFPVLIMGLNLAGVVTAKRLLGWWRIAVFLMFLFAAVVTPTPDPFNMTILALCMSVLYFLAVGVAFLNDRRKRRHNPYANLSDDEVSPLEPVSPVSPVDGGGSSWGKRDYDETP